MRNNVKFLRRSEGYDMTQEELAKALGVSRYTIIKMEKGEKVNSTLVIDVANYFNKDPREIFFTEDVAHVHRKQEQSC